LAQEQTQQTLNTETIELNGKKYKIDSFPEQERIALAHIEQIEAKMELTKIDMRNLEYGRQFLVDYLVKNVDKFEEVVEDSPTKD
jgi:hypothetical protein